jgi:hypothetical protein
VLKLVVAGAVVALLGAFALHHRHASRDAAQVASCLEKHGATAARSRFFEEALGVSEGGRLPDDLKKAEDHLFDVTVGSDSGLLMDTKRAHQDARIMAAAAAQGFDVTPQSRGKVLLLWFGGPSAESHSLVESCF